MADRIPVFSLVDEADRDGLKRYIEKAFSEAGSGQSHSPKAKPLEAPVDDDFDAEEDRGPLKLTPFDDLIGISPAVYRQIEAAINSGKQHVMFYGPPGTGKTTLARRLAGVLNGQKWVMITGSADWTSQDIIGGYQPVSGGAVRFFPGVLLKNFDKPLIIDELNRCDIDKVIGPLFTVLSGQATTLPYRLEVEDAESASYTILPRPKDDAASNEFAPSASWRLIATINTIDKGSLYQMSYALSRRFGWIFVDAPEDTKAFVQTYTERVLGREPRTIDHTPPLAAIWDAVNAVRTVGPAPVIDAIRGIEVSVPGSDLLEVPSGDLLTAYIDAFDLFFLPLLDGILSFEAERIADATCEALALGATSQEATQLKRRVLSVAI